MILRIALIIICAAALYSCLPEKPTGPAAVHTPSTPATPSAPSGTATQSADAAELTPARGGAEAATQTEAKTATRSKTYDRKLPETACQLVTEKFLGELIGVDYQYISVKNASGADPFQRSCFFRWDQDDTPNAGVLLQVQINPIEADFPDWAENFIPSKMTSGDNAPDGSASFKYKSFDGIGEEGAYNFHLSRYYWRTKDNRIVMIAFNIPTTEPQQVGWAKRIAREVMSNL